MNYIFIEGLAVYIFIFLIVIFVLIAVAAVFSAIVSDYKLQKIRTHIVQEHKKYLLINRENIRLKMKCGELIPGEDEDVQV